MKANQEKVVEPPTPKVVNENKPIGTDAARLLMQLKESQRIIRENPLPGKRRS